MGKFVNPRSLAAAGVAASSLLLSGCLLTPGAFTSEMTLAKGGAFTFTYDGEIAAMGLSDLARMGTVDEFKAECFDDDFEQTECTAAEIAEQQSEWETEQAKDKAEKEQFVQMMGGLDPSDPESAQKLADSLSKQAGFRSVTHVGNGVYDVDFAVSGRMTHSFVFPLVEKMPTMSPFVVAVPRGDGSVRIEAPGFGGNDSMADPGMAMMMGMASKQAGVDAPKAVLPDGTFTIRTDGRILANNTDEGPSEDGGMQVLSWDVNTASKVAPMALIALD